MYAAKCSARAVPLCAPKALGLKKLPHRNINAPKEKKIIFVNGNKDNLQR